MQNFLLIPDIVFPLIKQNSIMLKPHVDFLDKFRFLGNCPSYPSHKLALTLTSNLGQNDDLGEG